jgi:ABC-2 type transport system ATP-binding protein
VKTLLLELRARGKAVIMSSHQLALVEALCDRIVLIHKGERVVYGTVKNIKEQFAGRDVLVAAEGDLAGLPGVIAVARVDGVYRLTLDDGYTARDLFRALAARPDLAVEHFEVSLPSLAEVFLKAIAR